MLEFIVPAHQATALKAAFAESLGVSPEMRPVLRQDDPRGAAEVMAAAALILAVPPCVISVLDLAERLHLIDALKRLFQQLPPGTVARSAERSAVVAPGSERALLELVTDPLKPLYDVFLSAGAAEESGALALVDALRRAGLSVWWVGDSLRAGERWSTGAWNAQRLARATVVLVSPGNAPSLTAEDEQVRALALSRERGQRLIPIYCTPPTELDQIPPGMAALASLDLTAGVDAVALSVASALKGARP